jgi:hypothetical protein
MKAESAAYWDTEGSITVSVSLMVWKCERGGTTWKEKNTVQL